jgi:hypothetical protein
MPTVLDLPRGALREFCQAIEAALTLDAPATTKVELTYLRISRDRARVVLFGCKGCLLITSLMIVTSWPSRPACGT